MILNYFYIFILFGIDFLLNSIIIKLVLYIYKIVYYTI